MMQTVGAYEAKTHLPELLDRVAKGETITITKHGKPVAQLIPAQGDKPDVRQVVDEMLEFRDKANVTLGGVTIRELIEEGRRY
jgi:prevent-host-death family protein